MTTSRYCVISNESRGTILCWRARLASTFRLRLTGLLGVRNFDCACEGERSEVTGCGNAEIEMGNGETMGQANAAKAAKAAKAETFDGLLIRPSSAVHTFGMAFPIDVVALDRKQRILAIRQHLLPQRMAFFGPRTKSVLELPDGHVDRAKLRIGDRLSLESNLVEKETRDLGRCMMR